MQTDDFWITLFAYFVFAVNVVIATLFIYGVYRVLVFVGVF